MANLWKSNTVRDKTVNAIKSSGEIIVFDTETTGLSPSKGDRIIQLSAKKYKIDGTELVLIDTFSSYVKPPCPIESNVEALTGITNDVLKSAPTFREIFPKVKEFFGDNALVCGQNVRFDVKFMESEYALEGEIFKVGKSIDTLEIARERIPKDQIEDYKLFTILKYLGLEEGLTAHNSWDDVEGCARVLKTFLKEYISEWEEDRNITSSEEKERPDIISVLFWKGYRGQSRVYVTFTGGVRNVYYDIRSYGWGSKTVLLDSIDMEYVEKKVLEITGCQDTQDLSKFKGRIMCA